MKFPTSTRTHIALATSAALLLLTGPAFAQTNRYFDTSASAGLQGGAADWSASAAVWQSTAAPGDGDAPILWSNGNTIAYFQTGASNTLTVIDRITARTISATDATSITGDTTGASLLTLGAAASGGAVSHTLPASVAFTGNLQLQWNPQNVLSQTLTLNNANTHTGGTAIRFGTIAIGDNGALGTGPITLGKGARDSGNADSNVSNIGLRSTDATARTITNDVSTRMGGTGGSTLGSASTGNLTFSGTFTLNGGWNLTVANSQTTISGALAGTNRTLTKLGAGTLVLSNASNTLTGTLNADAGVTQVDGGLASGLAVTVGTSGTLKGIGTIGGPLTINGKLAPGQSVGTLTATNNATINGLYEAEVNTTAADLLALTDATNNTLTLGASSVLDVLGTLNTIDYTLATYGSLSGTFFDVKLNGVTQIAPTSFGGVGGTHTLVYGDDRIMLEYIPEPASFMLLVAGTMLMLPRRRCII